MANTYYDSQLTAEEIENALEAIDGVIDPSNNGKVLAVENGKVIAKSVVWPGANMQSKTVTPNAAGQTVEPDSGYDGLSAVTINGDSDLVAGNIKKDVNIFGVTGSYEGSSPTLQSKTVTPGASQQTVQPDSGYDGLSSVVVNGDADLVAGNIKKNVEIFGVTGSYEGSGSATLVTKNITQNGTYNASADNADGYSQVTVSVSGGGTSYPIIDAIYAGTLGALFGNPVITGKIYPADLSESVLTFMNNYARSKYGTKKDGSTDGVSVEVTAEIAQEETATFKARFGTLKQAEYYGYVTSAMITALGLVELGRNTNSGSSMTLSDSIENYSAVLAMGVYGGTQMNSQYNTSMLYINPQLNTQYWTGMKDRNSNYDRYFKFTSNTTVALSGGSSTRGIVIYGVP